VVVRLAGSGLEDEISVRIGFREARFTEKDSSSMGST